MSTIVSIFLSLAVPIVYILINQTDYPTNALFFCAYIIISERMLRLIISSGNKFYAIFIIIGCSLFLIKMYYDDNSLIGGDKK